jgi:hypothetical protein
MFSISTIPSIPVCRQAGMLGPSNGVKLLVTVKNYVHKNGALSMSIIAKIPLTPNPFSINMSIDF